MELTEFARQSGEWLSGEGSESAIVISSRVRLARNLAGFRFPTKASADEKLEIAEIIAQSIREAPSEVLRGVSHYIDLEEEDSLDRQLMVERRLISKEHAKSEGARGVAFDHQETTAVMINEEDHIRIQVLRSGLDLDDVWTRGSEVDAALGHRLRYAFSPRYGFLTACPTNVGTGLRISVMLHLPAVAMIDHVDRVKASGEQLNLAVRGLYGEGSRAHGDFFQISNQVTLGKTEEQLKGELHSVIPKILGWENKAREQLFEKRRSVLEDKVWRSYGTLSSARRITSDEALDCLSSLRLGTSLGIIDRVPMITINELFLFTQPAHLQKLEGKALPADLRDEARARFIRSKLA